MENDRCSARNSRFEYNYALVKPIIIYIHILYLNTIWFKAQSLWGRVLERRMRVDDSALSFDKELVRFCFIWISSGNNLPQRNELSL